MPEQEPRPSQQCDAQAVATALGTRPATVRDVAYGEGHLFSAGHGTTRLEVFPRSGVTRLTTQDVRVELFGTADAAVSDTGVAFHRSQPDQQASLTVVPGGGVVFTFLAGAERTPDPAVPPEQVPSPPPPAATEPGRGPQPAPQPAPEPASPSQQPSAVDAPSASLTAPAGASATEPPTTRPTPVDTELTARQAQPPPRAAGPEQAPRVQLSGRLGRDPTFRTTTKTGTLVGRFPLAEHAEDGTTRWHTVLAFGDRAKLLQRRTQAGELAQGREVEVVGYLHTNTRPGKDGRTRPVQEVYATAVTRH